MLMTRLIYCSQHHGIGREMVADILQKSRRNNAEAGVTGLLVMDGRYFLQCLEGSRDAVNATYHRIIQDSAHCHPVLLSYQPIDQREFADWDMGYLNWQQNYRDQIIRFSTSDEFNPYALSDRGAQGLVSAFRDKLVPEQRNRAFLHSIGDRP